MMEKILVCKSEHDARTIVMHSVRHGHAFSRDGTKVFAECENSVLDAIMIDSALSEVDGWFPPPQPIEAEATETEATVPETVSPEVVDEALHETIPETLGALDTEIDQGKPF